MSRIVFLGCLLGLLLGLSPPAAAQAVDGVTSDIAAGEVIAIERESAERVKLAIAVPGVPAGVVPAISVRSEVETSEMSIVALDSPPTVVLAFDQSGSMEGRRLDLAKAAAAQCLELLPANTSLALILFNGQVDVAVPLTTDREPMLSALEAVTAIGNTATFDAVVAATELVSFSNADSLSERASRFIVLLSDGEDTASTATVHVAAASLLRSGFRLYALGVDTEEGGFASLEGLAESAGGLVLNGSAEELASLCSSVADRIDGRFEISVEFVGKVPSTFTVELGFDDLVAEVVVAVPGAVQAWEAIAQIEAGPVDLGSGTGASAPLIEVGPVDLSIDTGSTGADPGLAPSVEPDDAASPAAVAPDPVAPRTVETPAPAAPVGEPDRRIVWLGAALAMAAPIVLFKTVTSKRIIHGLRIRSLPRVRLLHRLSMLVGNLLERKERGKIIDRRLELAALSLRAGEYVVFVVLGSLAAASVLTLIGMVRSAALVVVLVPTVSWMWIARRGKRRASRFQEQLGDTLLILAGALRSGSSLMQALGIAASKAPSPTSDEFQRVISEVRIGRDLGASLRDLADRMESEDARWLVEAIALNRELGGNLAKTLDNVGETIGARAQVKAQVAVMSAEGRLTASILIGLPFFISLVLQFLNPGYLAPLFSSSKGHVILAIAGGNMLVGTVWIRKLIHLEY